MTLPNLTVRQLLASLPKNTAIYYRANPGNGGDSLIATGAYKLFREYNLTIQLVNPDSFNADGKIVIYAGGGNLVGIYPEARDFFYKHHKTAARLILLPHTVNKNKDLLAELGNNVTIFAREKISYEYLKKYAPKSNIYIDHDLAFHLDVHEIINQPQINFMTALVLKIFYKSTNNINSTKIPSVTKMTQNYLHELIHLKLKNRDIANCFRDDVEKIKTSLPKNNTDLSTIYEYSTRNEDITFYATQRLLKYIDNFKKIRTDRLHICIAAALLGKEVEFYPNSYYKCQAVYEYSISEKFKKVIWINNHNSI